MSTKRKKKKRKPSVKVSGNRNKLGFGQMSRNYSTLRNLQQVSDEEKELKS